MKEAIHLREQTSFSGVYVAMRAAISMTTGARFSSSIVLTSLPEEVNGNWPVIDQRLICDAPDREKSGCSKGNERCVTREKTVAARERNSASARQMRQKRHCEKRVLRSEKAVFGGPEPRFDTFALIMAVNY
jgi:hypothetical protein